VSWSICEWDSAGANRCSRGQKWPTSVRLARKDMSVIARQVLRQVPLGNWSLGASVRRLAPGEKCENVVAESAAAAAAPGWWSEESDLGIPNWSVPLMLTGLCCIAGSVYFWATQVADPPGGADGLRSPRRGKGKKGGKGRRLERAATPELAQFRRVRWKNPERLREGVQGMSLVVDMPTGTAGIELVVQKKQAGEWKHNSRETIGANQSRTQLSDDPEILPRKFMLISLGTETEYRVRICTMGDGKAARSEWTEWVSCETSNAALTANEDGGTAAARDEGYFEHPNKSQRKDDTEYMLGWNDRESERNEELRTEGYMRYPAQPDGVNSRNQSYMKGWKTAKKQDNRAKQKQTPTTSNGVPQKTCVQGDGGCICHKIKGYPVKGPAPNPAVVTGGRSVVTAGFESHNMPGDGDCQFYALAFGLANAGDVPGTASKLLMLDARKGVAEQMLNDCDDISANMSDDAYMKVMAREMQRSAHADSEPMPAAESCRASDDGEPQTHWGNGVTISAFARKYEVNVHVHSEGDPEIYSATMSRGPKKFVDAPGYNTVHLLLNGQDELGSDAEVTDEGVFVGRGNHYDALIPLDR